MPPLFSLSIDGGYNGEAGPSVPHLLKAEDPVGTQILSVPYLIEAQNIVFNADGWPQKMPGASNVNGTATGATDDVTGIFDYWRSGTGTSQAQQRVIVAGTQIYTESGGTLTSIGTGFEDAVMPWFEVVNDSLIITSTSPTDVPQTWNQTTLANLGGSPPNFDIDTFHKTRTWAAGADSNKSRLYYSAADTAADWTGAGSGSIDIAPDDGDVITGLWSHKNRLIIFKGPNRNSIFYITGSAPTGSDAFALVPFARGVGCVNQQSIVMVGDDLVFWDDNGIHSLASTEQFGDFREAFLSRPIATYFTKQLNHSRFDRVWGANFVAAGYALWTVSRAGSTTNDLILGWDYRFTPPRFFFWPAYAAASLAMVRDTSREVVPWAGTYAGRVMRLNRAGRNVAGIAYTGLARLPYLSFGDAFIDKTITRARVGFSPKGETTFTLGWQRDTNAQQTASITQAGTATLGASSDQFALDEDTLAGGAYRNQFPDLAGSFKELQLELSQGGLDVDMEPHSLTLEVEYAGMGTTALVG